MPLINTLQTAGLDHISATIYIVLVENGELQVPQIAEYTELSRASVYEALNQLMAGEYIEYRKSGRNAYYKAVHPDKLYDLIEQKKRETRLLENDMKDTIKTLVGEYNLTNSKPGIRYFEGKNGMLEILEDSLTATDTIYTYADIEAIVTYIEKENNSYVKQRDKLGISKKAIIADSPFAREYLKDYHKETTDIKFIGKHVTPFGNVMQIYDGKISYITLSEKGLSGMIIQDPAIYNMHKDLFDYTWDSLKTLSQSYTPSPTNKNKNSDDESSESESMSVFDD